MELGRLADGRPFVNVASAGLASAAAAPRRAAQADARPARLRGRRAPRRACRAAAALHASAPTASEVFDGGAWQAIVAVTGAFGGGAEIGAADPDDGVLDATILPAGSRLGLARRAWGLRRGTIAEQHDVCHARGTVVEVGLPAGHRVQRRRRGAPTAGMERITVEHRAYELVVG